MHIIEDDSRVSTLLRNPHLELTLFFYKNLKVVIYYKSKILMFYNFTTCFTLLSFLLPSLAPVSQELKNSD